MLHVKVDFVLATPELAALRGRMMKIAAEAGLADVHNDSVHLLMHALEVRASLCGLCVTSSYLLTVLAAISEGLAKRLRSFGAVADYKRAHRNAA